MCLTGRFRLFDSVLPSCSSSWPTGLSLFQKPVLCCCFCTLFPAFEKKKKEKKKSQKPVYQYFKKLLKKIRGGKLGNYSCCCYSFFFFCAWPGFLRWFTLGCNDPSIIPAKCCCWAVRSKAGLSAACLEHRWGHRVLAFFFCWFVLHTNLAEKTKWKISFLMYKSFLFLDFTVILNPDFWMLKQWCKQRNRKTKLYAKSVNMKCGFVHIRQYTCTWLETVFVN